LYTFYYPGFNLRSTDLQAFIGRSQLKKLNGIIEKREQNFELYKTNLPNFFCQTGPTQKLSSFAYGTLVTNRLEIFEFLKQQNIECRPLICGNIGKHPFWLRSNGMSELPNADKIHDFGIYLPNHHNLTDEDIMRVTEAFLTVARPYDEE
jgi:CDP-6-deoxy-D-xylo-4-hexulose-3-dehydrase